MPARAWLLSHFLEDVYRNGITPYNRNYIQRRFQKHFSWSSLSSYRGFGPIRQGLKALLPGADPAATRQAYDEKVESWRRTIENEYPRIGYPVEVAALHDILSDLRSRGIEATIVIYPLMPGINTDKARATTIRAFREIAAAAARQYGARFVDFSVGSLLTDAEFESDFDHVTPAGDRRFADWALDHELRFLRDPLPEAGDRRP